jgi:HPt (histidine-containing phosphotransfer) domain-containing protein
VRDPQDVRREANGAKAYAAFGDAARPEILLPGASLSLGLSLLLLQPHPLLHPVLSYGILLCTTAALFLYGRKVGELLTGRSEEAALQKDAAPQAANPEAEHGSIPAIDAAAFGALEKSLGIATLLEILRAYLLNAEQLIATLGTMADEQQWPHAIRIAQDIAGAAGGCGLTALTAAARNFAQQARDGRDSKELRRAAQRIVAEHLRVRGELTRLSSRLAA